MSKNCCGISKMTARAEAIEEMREVFRQAGGDLRPGETKSRWLDRVAHQLGLSRGRVVSIEYRKGVVVHAHEIDMAKRRIAEQRQKEIRRLQTQLAVLEAMRQDNVHALVEDARQLLGPLFDRLVALGVVKVDGLEAAQDGEA